MTDDGPKNVTARPVALRSLGRVLVTSMLAVYWISLFIGTHIPNPPHLNVGSLDKVVHFCAFFGLTVLLATSWSMWRSLCPLNLFQIFTGIAVYGAFDELTQILANRSCELLDWTADLCGATTALVCFVILRAVWRLARPMR